MDAEDVHRSVVQWALGGTLIPIELVAVPMSSPAATSLPLQRSRSPIH